ncbi:MAG: xanthine dehydrogenase molybdopterin binding subunit [Methyloligellaceae bacterium]
MNSDIENITISSEIDGGVHRKQKHDSGPKHVTGKAVYTDDIPCPENSLEVYIAMSTCAHGRITSMDLSEVRKHPDAVCVLDADDIPGVNDVSPIAGDDPVFASDIVQYYGQSLFAVAANSIELAREAASLANVKYEVLPAIMNIDKAMEIESFLEPPYTIEKGDAEAAISSAPNRISGRIYIGGQEHFYLEGQASLAIPSEDEDVVVHCSTQHPSEIQHKVAHVLGVPSHSVTVEVRRMGGAFGGKESQGNLLAAVAALVAKKTSRAAKVVYDRDDDMMITGKRHDFRIDYEAGFDDQGLIIGVAFDQALRCGMSWDLSEPIADRAMFHADNCCFIPDIRITSYRCKTHTQSNTAFRGFGGPQGMVGIERVVDEIAHHLQLDPHEVRKRNSYTHKDEVAANADKSERAVTPYGMVVEDCVIQDLYKELEESSNYRQRREEIRDWNKTSKILKRGIALTPVKFGISFTKTFLNQAGALIHVYNDGSIHLNHGGTEMGQGLFTKVAQVVAEEFQVNIDRIKITATTTAKVPNTSATAASSGSDLNGMAAQNAAQKIKKRLIDFLAERHQTDVDKIEFLPGRVRVGTEEFSFDSIILEAYMARVSLSATGFYATPNISWEKEEGRGRPFFYFAYGAAVSEVIIDTLTGENKMLRVDILHDVGKSLNPAIDLGQIEGGFIQGAGWLTTEELVWDENGKLLTHAPSTYKIPACSDRPKQMNINLWKAGSNSENTIFRSKAVGEPPLMLGISTFLALSDAVASVDDYRQYPELDAPATPEQILTAVSRLSDQSREEKAIQ